jgi:hypothetical protein
MAESKQHCPIRFSKCRNAGAAQRRRRVRTRIDGVSYCANGEHWFCINRDVDAAYKIYYRWVAKALDMDLRPFDPQDPEYVVERPFSLRNIWPTDAPNGYLRQLYSKQRVDKSTSKHSGKRQQVWRYKSV